jgi:hypothetical protein
METQKVTAHLPVKLLKRAREITGEGLTETLKRALEELTTTDAFRRLRALRGIDVDELRRDKPRQRLRK